MIDIHTHILFGLDDGANEIEESIKMIKEEVSYGVTDIICTPHYGKCNWVASKDLILEKYNELCEEVANQNIKVNLYLGNEIRYHRDTIDLIKKDTIYSLNNTPYCLLEFPYTIKTDIEEIAFTVSTINKKAVIAHIERYEYLSYDDIKAIKELGALIQINADAVCGKAGLKNKSKVHKMIKNGLVDFVASDIHHNRVNYLEQAYKIILKKYGYETADKLFNKNALIFLNKEKMVA